MGCALSSTLHSLNCTWKKVFESRVDKFYSKTCKTYQVSLKNGRALEIYVETEL